MSEVFDVRAIRKRLGWTQEQLAAALGLERSTISSMETGRSEPTGPARILLEQIVRDHPVVHPDSPSSSSPAEDHA